MNVVMNGTMKRNNDFAVGKEKGLKGSNKMLAKKGFGSIAARRACTMGMAIVVVLIGFANPRGILSAQETKEAQEITAEQLRFFESRIRPVLAKECYSCHSARTGATRGGLMVDTQNALAVGGDSGPAIVPNDLEESLLWSAINYEDYSMPPEKMLSEKVIEDFRKWIEMGAPDPRVIKATEVTSTITAEDIEKGREFWAFKKPEKPAVPTSQRKWAETDIDRFVSHKLELEKLRPAKDASAETVLRRLTFDVVGLPPNPDQISKFKKQFKRDPQAAIESAVDELLASEQFGERWGRHWLDLARYAESSGREVNLTFPNAWRYRDYVIDSFNKDKPYDRFIQEQIAGDLLPVKTDEQWAENLTATGFLALGPKTLSERNGRQFSLDLVDEQVDVTTRVVLGVSVACARCHDHKFDPIPQADYYAMSGIFENTSTHYGTIDTQQNRRPSNLLISPISDSRLNSRKLSPQEMEDLKKQLADAKSSLRDAMRARRSMRSSGGNGNSTTGSDMNVARSSSAAAALEAKLNSYDDSGNPVTHVMGVQSVEKIEPTRVLVRGEFDQPGQIVDRGFPQVLCGQPKVVKSNSTGRLELARWMGSDENPTTARVMVNRIWQHMMGNGIVRTPENFGSTGQAPTHPELLDYLALRFVEQNWSVKSIIRDIALSRIYRTSSQYDRASFESDPENLLLWRYPPKRLEAEALRDSMLMIGGQIDLERPYASVIASSGGGVVRNGFIVGVNGRSRGGQGDRRSRFRQRTSGRDAVFTLSNVDQVADFRSVYLPVVRNGALRPMDVFDFAEPSMVVGKRETSNTPDQGLYFLNNPFVIEQSENFAKRLIQETDGVEAQIRLAFLWAFGRDATSPEISAAMDFYQSFDVTRRFRDRNSGSVEHQKLSAICQGILASAEFRILN